MNRAASRFRRQAILVIAAALIGLAGALTALYSQSPKYEAQAAVFVSTASAGNVTDLSQSATYAQSAVKSYAAIAAQPIVLDRVRSQLGIDASSAALATQVEIDTPLNTSVINIKATAATGAFAAKIADSVALNLARVVPQLSPSSTDSDGSIKITQTSTAAVPPSPVSPKPVIYIALGLIGGLLAGAIAAAVRERLDTRINDEADLQVVTDRPVLARVGRLPRGGATLFAASDAVGAAAEEIRSLRANSEFLTLGVVHPTIVVTSSVQGEGKTVVAANFALSSAAPDRRTLLIDADLRRPAVATSFGIDGSYGLTDVLQDLDRLDDAIQPWGETNLSILPAGSTAPNPSDLLQSHRLVELLTICRESYDLIVVDSAPLVPVVDAAVLARGADAVLMVCAERNVRAPQLRISLERLETSDATRIGLVINFSQSEVASAYYA